LVLPWLLRIWIRLPSGVRKMYLRLRYANFAVGVAGLIRDDAGRVLLVHRTYSRDEPWALPGGWIEGRDQPERGLERELLEETGLHIQVGPVLAVQRAGFAVVVLLQAELAQGASLDQFRPSAEVSALRWFELAQVAQLSPTNARLLRKAGLG
jgi:ADP-ribose pyrophosphatase YjhB (NUDIX family)